MTLNPRPRPLALALPALALAALLAGCSAGAPAGGVSTPVSSPPASSAAAPGSGAAADSQPADADAIAAPDFTLTDQFGDGHTLSAYQGQVVFLNFWATWCSPCRQEMPDLQALYEEGDENTGDYVVLGVANPSSAENPAGQDGTADEVMAFLEEGGYTYPTVMDTTGQVFAAYGISAFPTTFIINTRGNVVGYVPGMLSREQMDQLVAMGLE